MEGIDGKGDLKVRLDSGRTVEFDVRDNPHIDHGYAVTSHSARGAAADRVLVHIDMGSTHRNLINSRPACVAISRGRCDAQIYTNDVESLGRALGHEVSKRSAVEGGHNRARTTHEWPLQPDRGSAGSPRSGPAYVPGPQSGFEMDR